MLDKTRVIEHIRDLNRTARREWLETFDLAALRHYLDHLKQSLGPRTARAAWTRRGDTAAALTRRPVS